MGFKLVKRELFLKLGILCPTCGSCKVTTRSRDNMRRCARCGEEWPKKEYVKDEEVKREEE